jgi:HAD superfamily hydrolase (TIGR01509 family)
LLLWRASWELCCAKKENNVKKAAIFDMDGLMFDTERLYRESWMVLAEEFGQTPDPAFPAAIAGTAGEGMRKVIRSHYPNLDPEAFIKACFDRVRGITKTCLPEKPGLRQILELLKNSGVKMAVASSSEEDIIRRNLHTAGVEDYFDAVVSSTNPAVKDGKPAPDVFLYAAQKLGVDPRDCWVLEDSLNGIRAAYAAGGTAIMVPDTMEPTEEIRRICTVFPDLGAVAEAIAAGEL